MPRPDPGTPPELPATIPPRTDYITQTRHYRLITPLFGGGVEPGRCDPVTVVRAGEIRGHLRFWWRAARGGQFSGNLAQMKEAEDALWGAAGNEQGGGPSKVEVVVHKPAQNQRGRPFIAQNHKGKEVPIGKPDSLYSYVAFPLRDTPELPVLENVAFSLTITFPKENDEDVESALWAWETFGGVGARTRRGCGALQLTQINDTEITTIPTDELRQSIFDGLQTHVVAGTWPPDVPHLLQQPTSDWIRVLPFPNQSAMDAWVELFSTLKDFRQQRPRGRGRNRWPEPDAIRNLTGRAHSRHRQPINSIRKFPRAAFGLPIMFEFKRDDQRDGDPRGKNELCGRSHNDRVKYERLASPLLLRPMASINGAVGLALLLHGTHLPDKLVLNTEKGEKSVSALLSEAEAQSIREAETNAPLLGAETNVLRAFLNYLDGEADQ